MRPSRRAFGSHLRMRTLASKDVRPRLFPLARASRTDVSQPEAAMTAYSTEDVARLAEGLLDRSLPKTQWTHAAHLVATLRLVRTRDAGLEHDLPGIIRTYNEAVGGVNDDAGGYHETITQAYLAAIRAFAAALPADLDDGEAAARLLATPLADRAWPLAFWSRERLFSVAARRGWVAPDLAPLEHAPPEPAR